MNITRYNYEEYFLLYVDNELSPVDRNAVEVFVQDNPDLREELLLLEQSVLRPDKKVMFDDKSSLLKSSTAANPVNEMNCEEYFLLYGDDEISNEEKDLVEQFVYKHPQHQATFELLQKVRFTPDNSIVFPDKQSLYRNEKDEKVIVMRWWRIAAAAVVLLFMGAAAWYFSGNTKDREHPIALGSDTVKKNITIPAPVEKDILAQTIPSDTKQEIGINTAGKNDTKEKQTIRNTTTPQQPILANTINREKINSERDSNFLKEPNVKPNEIAIVQPDKLNESTAETKVTKPEIVDVVVSFDNSGKNDSQPNATFANNTDERVEVLNTSISNKTKMRGFFRKVGRVVNKASSFGNSGDGEDKKGLRIANFEIALK